MTKLMLSSCLGKCRLKYSTRLETRPNLKRIKRNKWQKVYFKNILGILILQVSIDYQLFQAMLNQAVAEVECGWARCRWHNKRPENEKTIIIIFEMDHNSPGQTPLWWVIPMMMIPMIDRNKGTLSLGGVSNYELNQVYPHTIHTTTQTRANGQFWYETFFYHMNVPVQVLILSPRSKYQAQ